MKKISLCIPTYNRTGLLYKSFEQVKNDPRIDEIIIVDDCSKPEVFAELQERFKYEPKVKLFRNKENLGCYDNKKRAVELSTNEWAIVFDSDNVIDTLYLDHLYSYEWKPDTIYAPDWAKPHFDYRIFSGHVINMGNVRKHAVKRSFDCFANTNNWFVPRRAYLDVWEQRSRILGADSIYFFWLWMKAGKNVYVVPGMQYEHLVHSGSDKECGSNYNNFAAESAPMCEEILGWLKQMR